jgi:hypothetical protein
MARSFQEVICEFRYIVYALLLRMHAYVNTLYGVVVLVINPCYLP